MNPWLGSTSTTELQTETPIVCDPDRTRTLLRRAGVHQFSWRQTKDCKEDDVLLYTIARRQEQALRKAYEAG